MRMPYLSLDSKTNEFVLSGLDEKEYRFPGTVNGAVDLNIFCHDRGITASMSSDLNHPNEFPKFEKYAIDIAAGCYEEAVAAGVINVIKPDAGRDLTIRDAITIAEKCLEADGGYIADGAELEAYRKGILAVVESLQTALKVGLKGQKES